MDKARLIRILDEQTELFKNNIAIELESTHDQWFENFGFPIFGVSSKDYHEQVYFQSYLESYTRKMINGILKSIIDYEVSDEIKWPEFDYSGIYNGYTNSEYESEFGFEFINVDRKIGYRYSSFHYDEIDSLLSPGSIENIKLVLWQDEVASFEFGNDCASVITLWELFQELFEEMNCDEIKAMYDLFVEYATNAVEQANSMISLTTMPGFTSAYLHKNRVEIVSDLEKDVSSAQSFYVKNTNYKDTEEKSKDLVSVYKLHELFLQKKYAYAFVGTTAYAKSFLTSEYLYRYFKKNPMFDYTPIVSGYIKSVEQLLFSICTTYRNTKRIWQDMGSWTMGNYKFFIDENEEIVRSEIRPVKSNILACLESYRVESRNHLFHRDYFNDWERVEQIRKNTIFLYFTLLGMIDEQLISENPKMLGILDDAYDRLFCAVDMARANCYAIEINGKVYSCMEKIQRSVGITYGWNGLIRNKIRFRKFDYDHFVEIEISPREMPTSIWSCDSQGNKLKLIWEV